MDVKETFVFEYSMGLRFFHAFQQIKNTRFKDNLNNAIRDNNTDEWKPPGAQPKVQTLHNDSS